MLGKVGKGKEMELMCNDKITQKNEGKVWGDFYVRLKEKLASRRLPSSDLLDLLKAENAAHVLAKDDTFARIFQNEFDKQYGSIKSQEDAE